MDIYEKIHRCGFEEKSKSLRVVVQKIENYILTNSSNNHGHETCVWSANFMLHSSC